MKALKVLIIKHEEGEDIFDEDGYVSSILKNKQKDDHDTRDFITSKYSEPLSTPVKSLNEIWEILGEGAVFPVDWTDKEEIDSEMEMNAIYFPHYKYNTYDTERINKKDFTEKQLVKKIEMLIWRNKMDKYANLINIQNQKNERKKHIHKLEKGKLY